MSGSSPSPNKTVPGKCGRALNHRLVTQLSLCGDSGLEDKVCWICRPIVMPNHCISLEGTGTAKLHIVLVYTPPRAKGTQAIDKESHHEHSYKMGGMGKRWCLCSTCAVGMAIALPVLPAFVRPRERRQIMVPLGHRGGPVCRVLLVADICARCCDCVYCTGYRHRSHHIPPDQAAFLPLFSWPYLRSRKY